MGRVAAIDYGLKRIGIAVSDAGKKIALPLTTVEGGKRAIENIRHALREKEVEKILVGYPLLMSGKSGEMAVIVEKFAQELEKALGIPVILIDERLSSRQAEAGLKEISLNRKERSERIDEVAATLLLQSYLDRSV
ncbi:MAG TPA: Holliday junction resolvase RuvX [Chlamydiales bacterium]|nr:Holliday junction resolvase RuvX [Chlamydiales bacterium]